MSFRKVTQIVIYQSSHQRNAMTCSSFLLAWSKKGSQSKQIPKVWKQVASWIDYALLGQSLVFTQWEVYLRWFNRPAALVCRCLCFFHFLWFCFPVLLTLSYNPPFTYFLCWMLCLGWSTSVSSLKGFVVFHANCNLSLVKIFWKRRIILKGRKKLNK